ncbi:MAG: TatD family hydrolase [Treponemataceae bacterium]|nr:TatD family hydrolase [Treponemataceae bacterium]
MSASIPCCNSHTHLNPEITVISIPAEPSVFSVCAEDIDEVMGMMPSAEGPENPNLYVSTGVHPWTVAGLKETELPAHLTLLEKALADSRSGKLPFQVVAVGECGFDLYGEERRASFELQHQAFHAHLELAQQYNLPLVIHSVKAAEPLLKHHNDLKKLPAVIFHGYSGSTNEAATFLSRGVNAYFSFGAAVLTGKGWPPRVLSSLPDDRILLETDGKPVSLEAIYQTAADIKNAAPEFLKQRVYENFCSAYLS